ncbi:hypothetical protein BDE02_10G084400 [Populus trichocarpa]|nr:hypothetical protein BDE02_10G084400 [Populus trichocarpa]
MACPISSLHYSNALAPLILLPSSFFLHRSERPPLTFPIVSVFFLLGLSVWLAQIFGEAGNNIELLATLGTALFLVLLSYLPLLSALLLVKGLSILTK